MILFKVRLIQIRRELLNLGFGFIVLLLLLIAFIYNSYLLFKDPDYSKLLFIGLMLIIVSIQVGRIDKRFILLNFQEPQKQLFIEYFLLSLPIFSLCLFTSSWYLFIIYIPILYAITYVKVGVKKVTYFRNITKYFPSYYFEWISGFRKSFVTIILLLLCSLVFSWARVFPLVLLWFLVVQIISFYGECESLEVLTANSNSARTFLNEKIIKHTTLLMKFILPISVINTAFNFDDWFIIIAFIIVFVALQCFAICFKYACYVPNDNSFSKSTILSMITLSSIIPYLFPIPFIFGIIYYKKAISNLKLYFND